MKKSWLFFFFLVHACTYAQYTLIPDLNFENKLISSGLDSGVADGKVLTSRINTRISLDVSYCNIADLTGIQDFVALTTLICNSNQLTALDLSKNTALTKLICSSNQLTTLNLSKNTSLKQIECYVNQLTALDLATNINLDNLDCSSNKLTTLDVTNNVALTSLKCYGNKLSTLDFNKNSKLFYLDCSANLLTALNVSLNTVLVTLNCSGNQLTNLDLKLDQSLSSFYCSGNQFKSLDISKNIALYNFGCSYNQLTALDVSNNNALRFLYCDSNQFTALDISKNKALFFIDCSSNKLLNNLNLKNGNNVNLGVFLQNNPNLTCIQVDDVNYSTNNWSSYKDARASFSASCALGLPDLVFCKLALYPNPTSRYLHIENITLQEASVYDTFGKLVISKSFGVELNNILDLTGIDKGVYFIYLQSEGQSVARKIIVE